MGTSSASNSKPRTKHKKRSKQNADTRQAGAKDCCKRCPLVFWVIVAPPLAVVLKDSETGERKSCCLVSQGFWVNWLLILFFGWFLNLVPIMHAWWYCFGLCGKEREPEREQNYDQVPSDPV